MNRIYELTRGAYARAIGAGVVVGILVLVLALIWRGTRTDTVVLHVHRTTDPNLVRVYVGGEVRSPGLYSLARGSRVADAIDLAGGVTDRGDTSRLGMAAPLRDADQIIVAVLPTPVTVQGASDSNAPAPTGQPTSSGPVNVNTAGQLELESLPGIGPALASRIIEFRERNGSFRSVEELEAVQGISARMVEDLRPLITTGP